ncbi:MAG: zinc metalloprotease HtpX [Armatimonadetes bacterium]|nr:zinc metalloprotease HtpX [Armatimonadota bacterium]
MGNTLKTTLLLGALTGLMMAVGGYLGGEQGMFMGLVVAGTMNFVAYWFSDKVVLTMYRAREVSPAEAPQLHAIVDDLVVRAAIPKPRVYVIPTDAPNAFATGRDPAHAAVAVTDGILRILGREELEGVIAHELAHVRNRDILISTIAATLAGAVMMVARMAHFAAYFGGLNRGEDEDGPSGIELLLMVILVPIAATIIQLAVSRSREYAADATGAQISGKPLALAGALLRLERSAHAVPMDANPATSHLFIVNPLSGASLVKLLSTHPSTEDRVARLQAMAGRIGPRTAPPDRYFA